MILLTLTLTGCGPEAPSNPATPKALPSSFGQTHDLLLVSPRVQRDGRFATSIGAAGDVDGDGYNDLLVGAINEEISAEGEGVVYLFPGGASGFDPSAAQELRSASSQVERYGLGQRVQGVGDLNADGYDDIALGQTGHDGVGADSGVVTLFMGSASGVDTSTELTLVPADSGAGHAFGALTRLGDANGDGHDDLVVGAAGEDSQGDGVGGVYLYDGGASGPDLGSERRLNAAASGVSAFGVVAGAGDVNGDGYADLLVGAPFSTVSETSQGAAFVYLGSSGGIDASTELELLASDAAYDAQLGFAVTGAGDLDADGFADIAVGAPQGGDVANRGAVYLYPGSASGVDAAAEARLTPSNPSSLERFGYTLSGGEDVDGDGYDDLVVGAPYSSRTVSFAGAGFLFLGGPDGLDPASQVLLLASNGGQYDQLGLVAGLLPDANGDGAAEVALGSYAVDASSLPDSGAVYVYYGACEDEDEDGVCAALDCDDEDEGLGAATQGYLDGDGDGYGAGALEETCGPTVDQAGDCDDASADVYPGAEDTCGDGVDSDCDGVGGGDDEDGDGLDLAEEQALGSDPCDADTDGDGLSDGEDPDPLVPEAVGDDSGGDDSDSPEPHDSPTDTGSSEDKQGRCASGPARLEPLALLLLLGALRRRRGR